MKPQQTVKPLYEIFEKFTEKDAVSVSNALDELDNYVKNVLGNISTTKMRNVYALIKNASLQLDDESKLRYLLYFTYKVAYMAAKEDRKKERKNFETFSNDISSVIRSLLERRTCIPDFFTFAEAIVAFHKKYAKK